MQLYDDGKYRGDIEVRGSITAYFRDPTLYECFRAIQHRELDRIVRELRHDAAMKRLDHWQVRHDGHNITVWRPIKHPQQMSSITFPTILMPWINGIEDVFGDIVL